MDKIVSKIVALGVPGLVLFQLRDMLVEQPLQPD